MTIQIAELLIDRSFTLELLERTFVQGCPRLASSNTLDAEKMLGFSFQS